MKNLDSTLASFHVCRQAYYSGTFVGNHIHTTLKVASTNLFSYCIGFEFFFAGEKPEISL